MLGARFPKRKGFAILDPTLQWWYDATDHNALAYLTPIALWSDKSGMGRHLNVVENGGPFKENWGGGLAAVSDTGSQLGLRTAPFTMPAYSFTAFVVCKQGTGLTAGAGDGNAFKRIFAHKTAGGASEQTIGLGRVNEFRIQNPANTSGTNSVKSRTAGAWGSDAVARIVRLEHDGTHVGQRMFFTGVEQAMSTISGGNVGTGPVASHALHLFAGNEGSGYSNQQVAEWMLYSPRITNPSWVAWIESYLASKWSV